MIHHVKITEICSPGFAIPVVDVRTPAEFAHGHIPGAVNLPLFTDEERVVVGTAYKQVGREAAILLGFDLTGTKWSGFIREALLISPTKKIVLHCWRGGMRSGAMAWVLDLYGFDVYLLHGGYKSYRKWTLEQFTRLREIRVIGGMTGAGKTVLLHQLRGMGQHIIDLEDLARHQGSAFGSMDRMVQPTQEQFENDLAAQLAVLDNQAPVWVEDESLTIGKLFVPRPFWDQMQQSPVVDIQVPEINRVNLLVEQYGSLSKQFLIDCTGKIRKRLGHERTGKAVTAITEGRMEDFIRELLVYYDKTYRTSMAGRDETNVFKINLDGRDPAEHAAAILKINFQTKNNSTVKITENGNR